MATAEVRVHSGLVPMLAVHDAAAAIEFYENAFQAEVVGQPYPWEGKIGHAELRIGDEIVMLADEFPGHNVSPRSLGGTPVILHLDVDDTDAWTTRGVSAGAKLVRAPENQPYGRISKLEDPFGHFWMLNGPVTQS